jgi:hypothetical protein
MVILSSSCRLDEQSAPYHYFGNIIKEILGLRSGMFNMFNELSKRNHIQYQLLRLKINDDVLSFVANLDMEIKTSSVTLEDHAMGTKSKSMAVKTNQIAPAAPSNNIPNDVAEPITKNQTSLRDVEPITQNPQPLQRRQTELKKGTNQVQPDFDIGNNKIAPALVNLTVALEKSRSSPRIDPTSKGKSGNTKEDEDKSGFRRGVRSSSLGDEDINIKDFDGKRNSVVRKSGMCIYSHVLYMNLL